MAMNGKLRQLNHDRHGIAVYHRVRANENFDGTVQMLLKLLREAQNRFPGKKRNLLLDIDGHLNDAGGYDNDMLELQTKFTVEVLLQFLSSISMPLGTIRNPRPQNDNIPDELNLIAVTNLPQT